MDPITECRLKQERLELLYWFASNEMNHTTTERVYKAQKTRFNRINKTLCAKATK